MLGWVSRARDIAELCHEVIGIIPYMGVLVKCLPLIVGTSCSDDNKHEGDPTHDIPNGHKHVIRLLFMVELVVSCVWSPPIYKDRPDT